MLPREFIEEVVGRTGAPSLHVLQTLPRPPQGDGNAYFIVLLGGEAGLRCGEIIALEWSDVDLGKRQLCVQRSEWRGHVTAAKSGRLRHVPMTVRLAAALREHRHLRAPRVICQRDGSALT
jgi:integrase